MSRSVFDALDRSWTRVVTSPDAAAALERHRVARLPEPVQTAHHRLLTDHLDGLVARAEGRVLEPAGLERTTPAPARQESPVAARLRAFGTPAIEPPIVAR